MRLGNSALLRRKGTGRFGACNRLTGSTGPSASTQRSLLPVPAATDSSIGSGVGATRISPPGMTANRSPSATA
jgi:hypothetical protein